MFGKILDIAIIAGSKSDVKIYDKVIDTINKYNEQVRADSTGDPKIDPHQLKQELRIISAHRNPEELDEYIKTCNASIFICVAGLSAALPGVVASKTEVPVIGVPVNSKLNGLDALLSIVQMPPGVPVACVGIDNGKNAALLAIRILKLFKN